MQVRPLLNPDFVTLSTTKTLSILLSPLSQSGINQICTPFCPKIDLDSEESDVGVLAAVQSAGPLARHHSQLDLWLSS